MTERILADSETEMIAGQKTDDSWNEFQSQAFCCVWWHYLGKGDKLKHILQSNMLILINIIIKQIKMSLSKRDLNVKYEFHVINLKYI